MTKNFKTNEREVIGNLLEDGKIFIKQI